MDQAILDRLASYVVGLALPTPLFTIGKGLRAAGVTLNQVELVPAMEHLVNEGRIFFHPPGKKTVKPSQWVFGKPPQVYVQDLVLNNLTGKPEWTEGNRSDPQRMGYR
jgi:hypothetical protein